jgi:glycerol kinase
MRHVPGLDLGTAGSTALVVSAGGAIVGRGYRQFPRHFPTPGWVEHDAEKPWNSTLVAAREALARARRGSAFR